MLLSSYIVECNKTQGWIWESLIHFFGIGASAIRAKFPDISYVTFWKNYYMMYDRNTSSHILYFQCENV